MVGFAWSHLNLETHYITHSIFTVSLFLQAVVTFVICLYNTDLSDSHKCTLPWGT